jgi:hypothetical protein
MALGWHIIFLHAYRPGAIVQGVTEWPLDAPSLHPALLKVPGHAEVVVFAHPFCPCTRATLQELDESLTRLPSTTAVTVVFVTAGLPAAAVADSDTIRLARQIPRVAVRLDDTGELVRQFGASISGEVFAFNSHGRRIYRGGLTPARGHQGDAAGQEQFEQLVNQNSDTACEAPVYGCPLPQCDLHHLPLAAPPAAPRRPTAGV